MAKTIKQLADELGVSKTAIRKYMSDDFRLRYTKIGNNGVISIDSAGCRLIASFMGRELVIEDCDELKTENKEFSSEREKWYMEQIESLREENKKLQNKLLDLSEKITNSMLADKFIEGKKLLDETAITSEPKKESRIKKIARIIIGG